MAPDDQLLNVLIIAHDAKATGGVNNFLRIMRRKLFGKVKATRFSNGRREGERGKLNGLRRMAWDYARFTGLVLSKRFDVLHINPTLDLSSLPRELVFPLLMSIWSPKTKKILFYRGWDWSALNSIKGSKWRLALYKFAHRRIDRVLVLSEEFRTALIDIGVPANEIAVVSTMFEGDVIAKALIGHDLTAPRNNIILLSRFLPAKGGAELLEAFDKIRATNPHLTLIMAGDGPSRKDWEQISENLGLGDVVHFTGYVTGKQKMDYLVSSDIFVLPTSHPEGMPNAILEAMAAGCAILSTPVAGIRDIVAHEKNGYIIEARQVDLIENGLRQLLSDRRHLREIGIVNHKEAWANWESQIVSDKILAQYKIASEL